MSAPSPGSSLQDAFQELVARSDSLDAAALEATISRYPQFTAELTEFAVEWVLQDQLPDDGKTSEGVELSKGDSATPSVLARFRQHLDARDANSGGGPAPLNPFTPLSPTGMRRVAAAVGIDKTLLAKLRDRRIVATTLPSSLNRDLASALQVPGAVLDAHLAAPACVPAGLSFKSANRPEVGSKETFADAVQRSSLDDEDKAGLLALD